jgi:hypothetical protein
MLLAIGLAPPILVVAYYAATLGLGPVALLWSWTLMFAGRHVGPAAAIVWSILLGCVVSVIAIVVRTRSEPARDEVQVTVRGPITYAGPGSLGGTESALRR